jgi:hypothetical protein
VFGPTGCWWGDLRERGHLEDLDVDEKIILKWDFKKWIVGGMEWIDMAQDIGRYWEIVKAVVNVPIP